MLCKICNHPTVFFATAIVLNKHKIAYYRCESCNFIQTEKPYWLTEAYTEAIASSDIGLVFRNLVLAKRSQALINFCFDPNKKFLDYGGGYGLFVRLMRDYGMDFYRYDKFCPNLFALGFDIELENKSQYELTTAFEVFEHLIEPVTEIQQMLNSSRNILFSTALLPSPLPQPHEWWYYTLDTGQHVSLYSRKSLEILANQLNLNFISDGISLHLFTEKKISGYLFQLAARYDIALVLSWLYRRNTLLQKDYNQILDKMKMHVGN